MKKTAIFVEGQTELIFVREFLLKINDYQDISVDCYTLFNDSSLQRTEYSYSNGQVKKHYQILNVGNDERVLSTMLRREESLRVKGFNKIIGLRDMYGKAYREAMQGNKSINPSINKKFIDGANSRLENPDSHFIYSIMEIEAWLLGLENIFYKMNTKLTSEYIQQNLNYDIASIDPETYFFHPADNLSELFQLAGKGKYDKSKSDVNSIVSYIDKTDYEKLIKKGVCSSFLQFYTLLMDS